MFGTRNKDTKVKKYIEPGVREVTLTGINAVENGTSKYLELDFTNDEGSTLRDRWYMSSEKSENITLDKLEHLATKIVTKKQYDEKVDNAGTFEEFGKNMNNLLAGHKVRILFCGKLVSMASGGKFLKAYINLPSFAESVTSPTALVFIPSVHVKEEAQPVPSTSDDLPF